MNELHDKSFSLAAKSAVITGGAGLLGRKHAEALLDIGARVILWDINDEGLKECQSVLNTKYQGLIFSKKVDITNETEIVSALKELKKDFGGLDILINNAACNPHVSPDKDMSIDRLEKFSLSKWHNELDVGLTGAFLCCKHIGHFFCERRQGVILNIASDLGVIAPDQRIYHKKGLADDEQPVKPITYSVVKHGLIGLTKYLSTYWADKNVRVNALSMGGVYVNQPDEFVNKLTKLIPMGRMADSDEYKSAVQFLCSDASRYMTGQNLIIDGGRTAW